MALQATVENLDDVPEALHGDYVERDGKFEIQVEGMKTAGDVTRVQESLRKERDAHKTTKGKLSVWGERTPDKFDELQTNVDELTDKLEVAGAETDEERQKATDKIVERQVGLRLRPVQRELDKLKGDNETLTTDNKGLRTNEQRSKVRKAVNEAAAEKDIGFNPEAHGYLEMLSEQMFVVDEGENVVTKEDLPDVAAGLTPSEALREMRQSGTHRLLFGATVSANASGGDAAKADAKDNPFTLDADGKPRNITNASRMIDSDPDRARRLLGAAGKEARAHAAFITFANETQAGS